MPHYHSASVPASIVQVKGENVKAYPAMHDDLFEALGDGRPESMTSKEQAEQFMADLLAHYPGVASGTHMEIGCHHAEMNVVCNAAASGVKTKGAWLIVTGEPCRMCAKLIHHAGIERVIVVKNGYAGANGVQYLEAHGVRVQAVDGPSDPRLTA
jgi:deoxycytidylate deaminase